MSTAYAATPATLALAETAGPGKRALNEALPIRQTRRETTDDVDKISAWYVACTIAMRKVTAVYPGDLDIKSVFVEAMMNEAPWQMWDLDIGKIGEGAGPADARAELKDGFETMLASLEHPRLLNLMQISPFP